MDWEAPAKLNLSLHVFPPRTDGYHPLVSMVQTIQWCDVLTVELGEGRDSIDSDIEDNIIEKALTELRREADVPPLSIALDKAIPMEAGLGGGSSDAAATLKGAGQIAEIDGGVVRSASARVGADVALFLAGGTQMMRGVGDDLESLRRLEGFALAVVVPSFGISTVDAYRRWDEMEGPHGEAVYDEHLPPALREGMPMRNDLLPAALDLEPRLGDFLADLREAWGTAACLTGSGSACFGYFADLSEARDAEAAVAHLTSAGRAVSLRPNGVEPVL